MIFMDMDGHVQISEEIEQYEKKIYDQKQLIHISKALNSNLELHSLIESILNISLAQSQTFQIGIYLKPEVISHEFHLHESYIGFEPAGGINYSILTTSPLLEFLAQSGRIITRSEIESHPKIDTKAIAAELKQLSSLGGDVMLVPLINRGKLNGLIVLGAKTAGGEYTASEKAFLADLAAIASIAVENARLYELATVDMMTRLKIHHFFKTRLLEEITASRETGEPLSLYMTDIDHFKKFNDTYGHQLGDRVLTAVASALIRNSRSVDLPSRYGGEEFAVILPKTSLPEATMLAERCRALVEKLEVDNPDGAEKPKLKVTLSAGVGQFDPKRDKDLNAFLERVDNALYRAKDAGRNRVETAD